MAEVVNLRQARKAKWREAAEQVAAENRRKHGETQSEKALRRREAERLSRMVDGAKRNSASDAD